MIMRFSSCISRLSDAITDAIRILGRLVPREAVHGSNENITDFVHGSKCIMCRFSCCHICDSSDRISDK